MELPEGWKEVIYHVQMDMSPTQFEHEPYFKVVLQKEYLITNQLDRESVGDALDAAIAAMVSHLQSAYPAGQIRITKRINGEMFEDETFVSEPL